ncbi:hypothetical protein ThidrDRAFT_4099 [Thiorhodococcus drewsii AZ1]|uniref:Uncharacterized protein n=1 Tax=Thiorhodococcus drewsii AZ1 TaxID=765913 RepID=G2E736_9GAMM|nr:hypothetical protein [Thiorhodococcus drewsii]EGV28067.1 hypothetical protein ThidrDRAFT_4099 [Thiorhodococcus drewsii AZ1]
MSQQTTTPKKRGRPATGQALSGAERQRRYRERKKARDRVTCDEKPSNPEHQRLFTIPEPQVSQSTAISVRTLPEQQAVTGDHEVDACLWLREVCKTATDPAVLELALEAAQRIEAPAKEIEDRYAAWMRRQPGVHPLQVAFASFNMADIAHQVERARERIAVYAEGLAVFGSYAAAMRETPAERMVFDTIGPLPDGGVWTLGKDVLGELFARSVNPVTLTEVAAELRYWRWLGHVRWRMSETADPDGYGADEDERISARRYFVEGFLTELAPLDRVEALHLADALADGLVDLQSTDDGARQAKILDHLLRTLPGSDRERSANG